MKKRYGIAAVLVVFLLIGCRKSVRAPRLEGGKKIALYILIDRGDPNSMEEKQFKMRNEVGEFMEGDLSRRLNSAGYEKHFIKDRKEFASGKDKYLLSIALKSYNPGSQAARILVGFGAGAASLDTHYELFGEGNKPLLSQDEGVGSSRGWRPVVMKVNEKTLAAVNKKMTEIYSGK